MATKKKKTILKSKSKAKASSRVVVNVNSHNRRPSNKPNTNQKQPQFVPVMINPNIPQAPPDTRYLEDIKKRLDGIDIKMKIQADNLQPQRAVSIVEPEKASIVEPEKASIVEPEKASIVEPEKASIVEQPEKAKRGPNTDIQNFMNQLQEHNKDWMNADNKELVEQMAAKTGLSKTAVKGKIKQAREISGSFAAGLSTGLPVGSIVGVSEAVKKIKSMKQLG